MMAMQINTEDLEKIPNVMSKLHINMMVSKHFFM